MRIGNQISRAGETAGAKTASKRTTGDAGRGNSSAATPDQAAALNREGLLARALAADGQERVERIQALSVQVEAGTYSVDSAELSRALVADWLASAGSE
jgi:anti-sigma28 factor (negative regulator of flagellin synthesis)